MRDFKFLILLMVMMVITVNGQIPIINFGINSNNNILVIGEEAKIRIDIRDTYNEFTGIDLWIGAYGNKVEVVSVEISYSFIFNQDGIINIFGLDRIERGNEWGFDIIVKPYELGEGRLELIEGYVLRDREWEEIGFNYIDYKVVIPEVDYRMMLLIIFGWVYYSNIRNNFKIKK
jgi:hypothetical protein